MFLFNPIKLRTLMKSFVEFKLNEIGDRIKTPHLIKKRHGPFP